MKQEITKVIFAGFFTRLLSVLVDLFIILLILNIFNIDIRHTMVIIIVWWLYHTIMLTKYKTTIGGKLFGIEILNEKGERLSFRSTFYRVFISIIPFIIYALIKSIQHNIQPAPSPIVQQLPQFLFILPPFLMFFTHKKQMIHDLLINSIVIDKNKMQYLESEKKESTMHIARKILRVAGTLMFLVLVGYLVVYVGVFFILAQQHSNSYNASFKQHYTVNDYNDTKIIFYNQELENNSRKFIEATGMYDIFEADVKNDLALNCIEYFLAQEYNTTNWIEMGGGFRKNARNKYANTKVLIKKAKKNEDHMGKYFYYYDLNDVNHITDEIANIWEKNANTQTCQKMLPVDQMYKIFIIKYIQNREKALKEFKHNYQYVKPSETPNKSFYKKKIKNTSEWLKILYKKYPKYLYRQNKYKLKKSYNI